MQIRNTLLWTTVLVGAVAFISCDRPAQTSKSEIASNASTAPVSDQSKTDNVNVQLEAWFEEKFMENVRQYPQFLAALGIKERMDEWNDPSRTFALEQLDITRQNLTELKSNFNRENLNENNKLSYDLYVKNANQSLDWHPFFHSDIFDEPTSNRFRRGR